MRYNYIDSKRNIKGILSDSSAIKKVASINSLKDRIHSQNGVVTSITAIFVNIVDSKKIYELPDPLLVSKILRSYTSETLNIINSLDENSPLETGVMGDIVYAIFSTPDKAQLYNVVELAFFINTMTLMLNKILEPVVPSILPIKTKIAVSTGIDTVVNATVSGGDRKDKIIIGESVQWAREYVKSHDLEGPIILHKTTYKNVIALLKLNNPDIDVDELFKTVEFKDSIVYETNIRKPVFEKWIKTGMKEI
ncbi:MAG TPA: hypothetical protein P5198_10405 [Flexilinea sp.]|nr:hypothetical protein [Flexilinea sp.]HRY21916.1 hypothetical protein [Flexilinea sp.]